MSLPPLPFLNRGQVEALAAGREHVVVSTADGKVFTWGSRDLLMGREGSSRGPGRALVRRGAGLGGGGAAGTGEQLLGCGYWGALWVEAIHPFYRPGPKDAGVVKAGQGDASKNWPWGAFPSWLLFTIRC